MANQAREEIKAESLTVVAYRGYYNGLEILACEQVGITTFVPSPLTSGSKAAGRFGKQDFIYLAASDEYRCPAGQLLTRRLPLHMLAIEPMDIRAGTETALSEGCSHAPADAAGA